MRPNDLPNLDYLRAESRRPRARSPMKAARHISVEPRKGQLVVVDISRDDRTERESRACWMSHRTSAAAATPSLRQAKAKHGGVLAAATDDSARWSPQARQPHGLPGPASFVLSLPTATSILHKPCRPASPDPVSCQSSRSLWCSGLGPAVDSSEPEGPAAGIALIGAQGKSRLTRWVLRTTWPALARFKLSHADSMGHPARERCYHTPSYKSNSAPGSA